MAPCLRLTVRGNYRIETFALNAREILHVLPTGSPSVPARVRIGRALAQALNVFALLVVALVCIDLCIDLALALDCLLTDFATLCRSISSR